MNYGFNQTQQNITVPQMNQIQQPQQTIQPLFPQPQGNVYNINSTLEVANVPVGAGMSIALCLPENCMYIKTMQNGNPLFYPYKIIPFTNENTQSTQSIAGGVEKQEESNAIKDLSNSLKECIVRIQDLEKQVKKSQKQGDDLVL